MGSTSLEVVLTVITARTGGRDIDNLRVEKSDLLKWSSGHQIQPCAEFQIPLSSHCWYPAELPSKPYTKSQTENTYISFNLICQDCISGLMLNSSPPNDVL